MTDDSVQEARQDLMEELLELIDQAMMLGNPKLGHEDVLAVLETIREEIVRQRNEQPPP